MADDDEVYDETSFDPASAAPGPRRSTFSPPTGAVPEQPAVAPQHDDDELAAALFADFSRLATGTIPVVGAASSPTIPADDAYWAAMQPPVGREPVDVPPPTSAIPLVAPAAFDAVPEFAAAEPVPAEPAPAQPAPAEPAPVEVAPVVSSPIEAGPVEVAPIFSAPLEPAPLPPFAAPTEFVPEVAATDVASDAGPPAWSSLPAPNPAEAVALPDPSDRPVRRSLPDEELLHIAEGAVGEPGTTLDAIEQLQNQLRLREEEARQFQAWENTMRTLGTADAVAAVEEARPEFTGIVPAPPVPAPESFLDPQADVAAWPAPNFDDIPAAPAATAVPPAAEVIAAPVPFAAEAFPEPAAPLVEPFAEPAPAAPEPASWQLQSDLPTPVVDAPATPEPDWRGDVAPDGAISDTVTPDTVTPDTVTPDTVTPDLIESPIVQAPPPLPAWEVPPPGPQWSPGPEFGIDEPELPNSAEEDVAAAASPFDVPVVAAPAPAVPLAVPFAALGFEDILAAPANVESDPTVWEPSAMPVDPTPVDPMPVDPTPVDATRVDAAPRRDEPSASAPEPAVVGEPQPFSQPPSVSESQPSPEVPQFSEPQFSEPQISEPQSFSDPQSFSEPPPLQEPPMQEPALQESGAWSIDQSEAPVVASFAPRSTPPAASWQDPTIDAAIAEPPALVDPLLPPSIETPGQNEWPLPVGIPLAPAAGDTAELPDTESEKPESESAAEPSIEDFFAPRVEVSAAAEQGPVALIPPPLASTLVSSSFDDLLSGPVDGAEPDEEPQPFRTSEHRAESAAAPEALFIEPMPVAAGEPVPTDTGSISVIDQAYEEELPDDVDETDRAFVGLGPVSVDTSGIAVAAGIIPPPSGPISTVRIPEHEVVLASNEPVRMKVFSLEDSGLDATPVDHRVGRAARLFWLWFASNSSILSLGLGATIFAVGMSLRQSIVAVLAGVALSFIPLGLTTLAGKRSGQPTMVVSRATFGLLGNVVPSTLALVTRLFWGAVLLWLLASSVAIVLVGAGLDGALGDRQLLLIALAVAFLLALLVAFAGYPLFARIQLILSIVSAVLIVGLVAMTWKYVSISTALSTPDGSWTLTITGAVLVFSFVGLVWANSGADLARYQRPSTSGAASMLWATVGTTLPTFVLIGYGALLAASDPGLASGFVQSPLDTLALMLPSWYPVPLIAATALSLLSGVSLSLYSGGFALQSMGVKVPRQWSIVIVAVLLGVLALVLTFGVTGGMTELFRDAATTLAVPTAAWAGIFAAEMMIRNRRFDSPSLLLRGGVYADVRWVNLIGLVVISAIGFGLTTATVTWLSWQGYGFTLLGMPLTSELATSDAGVLVALLLGILLPLVAGVPAIRRQEALRG